MPALSDPTTWRKPYAYRGWLYIDRPPAVFKARVDMSSWALPLTSITFDTVTLGTYEDATAGLTLLVGSSEGADDLGRIRLRKDSTSDTLYPGEVSQGARHGELNIANNAYLTVLDWRIPFVFAPYIDPATEIIYKDYDLAVNSGGRDYASEFGPIANGGCSKADNIDPDTSVATFEFDSNDSLYVTPGSSKASVTWDVIDGTITVGNANSDQITATFPEGRRYVTLTVEDDDGNTHTHYILVAACNPTGSTLRPILDFEITDHRLAVEGGELAAVIYEDIDPADYPEGAQVIYYEHEYYDGVEGSLAGPSGDEHIKFVGWLDGEMESPAATLRGIENGVELRAVSTAGRMRQVNLFPQRVDDSGSPTKWTQMLSLTPQRFMLYLLRWHSNICDIANIQIDGYGSSYEGIETKESTLYEQVDEIAQEVAQRFTCDQRGTLRIVDNPLLLDSGDRTATVIVALTEADISEYALERIWMPREYWIDASGITVGTSQASKYSRAPGDAPGQGAIRSAFDKQLVADQTDLNARVGHEYARRNTPWEPLRLQMVNTGDAGIDPALMEWIEVTTTASTNKRQRSLTDERCLPQEVQIEHSNDGRGVKEVEYTAFIETVGTPGATYVPPTDPQLKLPAYQFPQFELYVPTWEIPAPAVVDFASSPGMYAATLSDLCRSTDTSTPAWSSLWNAASELGANYALYRFRLDPWDPKNKAYIFAADATAKIVKVLSTSNLNDGSPTFSVIHTADHGTETNLYIGMDMRLSINVEGLVSAVYLTDGGGGVSHRIAYRLTPAGSWVDDTVYLSASGGQRMSCLGMGSHQVYPNGDMYALVGTLTGSDHCLMYKSTDLGVNWAEDEDFTGVLQLGTVPNIAIPYTPNPSDEIFWLFTNENNANAIIRRNADGTYTTGLGVPVGDGNYYRLNDAGDPFPGQLYAANAADIWNGDGQKIRFVSGGTFADDYLIYSRNGGGTWTIKDIEDFKDPGGGDFFCIGGWPDDELSMFLYGQNNIGYTPDGGDSFVDLRGSGATELFTVSTSDRLIDFVPVWVA
jgi:hypothetical protein